jgi:hypothetical protein
MTLWPIVGEVVERWGVNPFVRMVDSMKPTNSVKLASLRSQLICRVVIQPAPCNSGRVTIVVGSIPCACRERR